MINIKEIVEAQTNGHPLSYWFENLNAALNNLADKDICIQLIDVGETEYKYVAIVSEDCQNNEQPCTNTNCKKRIRQYHKDFKEKIKTTGVKTTSSDITKPISITQ